MESVTDLVVTGNEMGMTLAEVEALSPQDLHKRREAAVARLWQSGAHYVLDGIADVPDIIEEIMDRLEVGDTP